MIVIVINCGSSSLKFKLFDMGATNEQLAEGVVEEIGKESSKFTYSSYKMREGEKVVRQVQAITPRRSTRSRRSSSTPRWDSSKEVSR